MKKIFAILILSFLFFGTIWAANDSCNTTANATGGGEICLGPPGQTTNAGFNFTSPVGIAIILVTLLVIVILVYSFKIRKK
ncbi:MAG: hypothetical protein WCT31_05875 [Candidatus Micrarchaeia archaeon]|jgi:hypothetical protein